MVRSKKKEKRKNENERYYVKRKEKLKSQKSREKSEEEKKCKGDEKKKKTWIEVQEIYEINIRIGFTKPCQCCGRLRPRNLFKILTKEKLRRRGHDDGFLNFVFAFEQSDVGQFCTHCYLKILQGIVPRLCLNNGLKLPDVDAVIDDLNRVEERLISPNHIFQTIWPVMGANGQYRTKGAIVNVPVILDSTVRSLPRAENDTNIVHIRIARKMEYKSDFMSGFIRTKKVYDAAKVIVEKPLFRELGIYLSTEQIAEVCEPKMENCEDDVESIGSDDDFFNQETMLTTNQTVPTLDNEGIRIAPAEGYCPKSVLLEDDIDFLAFPKIFGGFRMLPMHNGVALSYSDVCKSLLSQADRRVAHRPDYILFMAKKLELLKLNSNINICLKKKILKKGHEVTAQNMLDETFVEGIVQHNEGFKVLSGIRSSASHWQEEKTKVMAMIRQFGIPTFFYTMSSADIRWPELIVQLKKTVDGEDISEEEAGGLSYNERARLIQTDPATCSLHFNLRFGEIKKTWKCEDGPFGNYDVSHSYHRIEFQQRGSPHVHMLIWLEGAPRYDPKNSESEKEVCDFIDSMITVSDEGIPPELYELQRHAHRKTCFKEGKPTECRFNIPNFPMFQTCILAPLNESFPEKDKQDLLQLLKNIRSIMNEKETASLTMEEFLQKCGINYDLYVLAIRASLQRHKIFLKRTPGQMFINGFNPKTLITGRANCDLQYILDVYIVACYVVDYMNKTDRGLSSTMDQALKEIKEGNFSLREGFRKIVNTYYNNSEMSVQEACYHVLQINMSECSEDCLYIPTNELGERVRMVKSREQLAQSDPNSTNIFLSNILDHYSNRPDILDDLCLADFAALYTYQSKKESTSIPLKNGNGYLHHRTRPRIIRWRRYCYEIDPDNYYREHIMLFVPWHDEQVDIVDKDLEQTFINNKDLIIGNKKKYCALDDIILSETYKQAAEDAHLREVPEEFDQERPHFDFDSFSFEDPMFSVDVCQVEDENSRNAFQTFKSLGMITDVQLQEQISVLNNDQRDYITSIAGSFMNKETFQPFYHLLTGGAGVGKSMVINVLYQVLLRIFMRNVDADPEKPQILLCAPTGCAAFLIGGRTMHSAFKFPANSDHLHDLSPDVSNTMSNYYKDLKLIIIDEISMVGQTNFDWMNRRLQHIFHSKKLFGGISILVVGDFFQLPPVFGTSLLARSKNPYQDIFGNNLWHMFETFKLTKIMRQSEIPFQKALNNLARGTLDDDDLKLFLSRVTEAPENPAEGIHIFQWNKHVDAWNIKAVNRIEGKLYVCNASDIIRGTGTEAAKRQMMYTLERLKTNQCLGIPKTVNLKAGAKYTMTYNVDTEDGLTNGAPGTLMKIDCGRNSSGAEKPLRLWVAFDDDRVGQQLRNRKSVLMKNLNVPVSWTPVEPIIVTIRKRNNSSLHINRMQFPITLAHAVTSHKVQGRSILVVYVHLIPPIRRASLYVACSRATSIEGLHIIGNFKSPTALQETDYLYQEILRWKQFKMIPQYKFLRKQSEIQIMFHNIQSLPKHWLTIEKDETYLNSTVLMFAETWTKKEDDFQLPTHKLIIAIDNQEARKPRGVCIYIQKRVIQYLQYYGSKEFIFKSATIQVAWIVLADILFASVYATPNIKPKQFAVLFNFLSEIKTRRIIIMGDFNINHKDESESKILNNICTYFKLGLKNKGETTTIGHNGIDWIVSDMPIQTGKYVSFSSYHFPLWARINSL